MKNILLAVVFGWSLATVVPSRAITFGPFGPNGQGGTKNGQTMTIGPGGTVFELDGFLDIDGMDLNGSQYGVSAQLSRDALPAGMVFSFTNYLSSDQADLVLSYTFTNSSSTVFSNLYFFVLLDPEIDEQTNTFFNEYGGISGTPGLHGFDASQWQIDEPDFQTGTLLKNIFLGALNGSNAVPPSATNDVAMSLGFSLGNLNPGAGSTVLVQISQQGDALGSFSLAQHDSDPASTTVITLSGLIPDLLVLKGQVVSDGNTTSTNAPANPSTIGLSNVVVTLSSNSIPVMTNLTDSAGQYVFSVPPGIQPGTYAVSAIAPGLTFVSVPPAVKAYFATSNPATTTLPMLVPVLNFDFRGAVAPPPSATTTAATSVTTTSAQLNGNMNGNGLVGTVYFQYGTTTSYGSQTPPGDMGPTAGSVSYVISNLKPNTLYHYQVVASTTAGTTGGGDTTFTTSPPPPSGTNVNVSGFLPFGLSWKLNYATGSLLGTLSITNPTSGSAFGPPWQLGLKSSPMFYFAHPAGTLPDGVTNIDVSTAMNGQLPGGVLNPGVVVLTNAVEIYSLYRSAPTNGLFEIWATPK